MKNGHVKFNAFLWIMCFFYSCSSGLNSSDTIINIFKTNEPLLFSSYFSDIHPIILVENRPLGTLGKVDFADDFIVISSFDLLQQLAVYDLQGHLMAMRDDIGEGPEGFGEISDFAVYDNKIYVLQGYHRKISVFDSSLRLLEEIKISYSASGIYVNDIGIYLYHLESNPDFPFRLSFFEAGNMNGLIQFDETLISAPLTGNFFIGLDSKSFIHYHPASDSIYLVNDSNVNGFHLNFGSSFIDIGKFKDLHPLERLKAYNEFEGYKDLSNGVRLSASELLFSISHEKKKKYLKVDLTSRQAQLIQTIKNDLLPLPSNVFFEQNHLNAAWYWQNAETLSKFYQLNGSKIEDTQKINLPNDPESKVVFNLPYK